jgi:hypothetical protein
MFYLHPYDEDVPFNSERDNRFEAGLLAGVGLAYELAPCGLFVTARYHYGLTDLQKDYQKNLVARYNNTLTLQAGVLLNASFLFDGGSK